MERVRRLAALWSWLPAFRVVAECQHLPTASKQLHVSPSALSRTVRLLEEEIGQPLFVREGRSLRLNDAGERFLSSTRDAMRILDEGIAVLDESQDSGPLHLAIPSQLGRTVARVLTEMVAAHPKLIPTVHDTAESDLIPALLAGRLDVVICEVGIEHERLSTQRLTMLNYRVYAAPTHALATAASIHTLEGESFVAPPSRDNGAPNDAWPGGVARQVTMVAASPAFALEVAYAGGHLIYLPSLEAQQDVDAGALVELNFDVAPPSHLYALTRPVLGAGAKADRMVAFLKEKLNPDP